RISVRLESCRFAAVSNSPQSLPSILIDCVRDSELFLLPEDALLAISSTNGNAPGMVGSAGMIAVTIRFAADSAGKWNALTAVAMPAGHRTAVRSGGCDIKNPASP